MDLDSARNAKAEIFRRAFQFVEAPRSTARAVIPHFVMSAARAESILSAIAPAVRISDGSIDVGRSVLRHSLSRAVAREPAVPPPVAIGIGGSAGSASGNHLVLLAPRREHRHHPLVERAIALAGGEAQFIHCGANGKLSHWLPPRRRPLCPGLSVAHYRVTAGTLGGFVDFGEDSIGILSNNHVLADINRARTGDEVLQPGKRDQGTRPGDVIATLERFVPLKEGSAEVNRVDAAIARLTGDNASSQSFPEQVVGAPTRVSGTGTAEVTPGEPMFKFGRTTGFTRGMVFAIEVDNYVVNLGSGHQPFICRFDDQFQVYSDDGHFASVGDSGSLVLGADGAAQGLLFAGTRGGAPSGFGIATVNPISAVLEELDTRLSIA